MPKRSLTLGAVLGSVASAAVTLPSAERVSEQAVACKLQPDQVTWRPGEREIVAVFVMADIEKDPEGDRAREGGACLEAWAKMLGLHPVITVQIPEGH